MSSLSEGATIRLHRHRRYRDKLRNYKVVIDGEERGVIRDGGELTFEVTPGEHEIQVRVDWIASTAITVKVPAGDDVSVICRAARLGRAGIELFIDESESGIEEGSSEPKREPPPGSLSLLEVSERLGLSSYELNYLVMKGLLPATYMSGGMGPYFDPKDVEEYEKTRSD